MKKKVIALVLSALMVTGLVGCGSDNNSSTAKEGAIKVGMVTDTGTIDDKSFNQGTWEGIKEAEKEFGLETTFMQPNGESESSYLTAVSYTHLIEIIIKYSLIQVMEVMIMEQFEMGYLKMKQTYKYLKR